MEIWKQQRGEGDKVYNAFKCYLKCRNIENVSKTLNKSISYTRNLASKHEWRRRAAEFDAALFEEARQEIKAELSQVLRRRWSDCAELQEAAIEALRAKDLRAASFKSLNEIYHTAAQLQLKLLETFKILDDDAGDNQNLTINIVPRSVPVN